MNQQRFEITKHFKDRCKSRLGISKKDAEKYFYRAYNNGLKIDDFKNNRLIYKYLCHLTREEDIECVVYCHHIIIYSTDKGMMAITLLNIPTKYIDIVDKVLERKRNGKIRSNKNPRYI